MSEFRLRYDRNNETEVLDSHKKPKYMRILHLSSADNMIDASSIFNNVTDLQLMNFTIHEKTFVNTINNCKNLNHLSMREVKFERSNGNNTVQGSLQNLVIIVDEECQIEYFMTFLRIFMQTKCLLVEMTNIHKRSYSLGEFLSIQKNLKTLGVSGDVADGLDFRRALFNNLISNDIKGIEKLSFKFLCSNFKTSHRYMNQLGQFLSNNKRTLKVFQFSNSVLNFDIIKELELHKLIIDVQQFIFNDLTRPNRYLQNLIVKSSLTNYECVKLIEMFPNIESLSLKDEFISYEAVLKMKDGLTTIKCMNLQYHDLTSLLYLEIPTLRLFSCVIDCGDLQSLRNQHFIDQNPNIETLVLFSEFGELDYESIYNITRKMTALKRLILHEGNIQVDDKLLFMLHNNCSNLTSFELRVEKGQEFKGPQKYKNIQMKYIFEIEESLFSSDDLVDWSEIEDFVETILP